MFYGRFAIAEAKEDVAAQVGPTCTVFTCWLKLFGKSSADPPETVPLREVTGQEVQVINSTGAEISEGDQIVIAQTVDRRWVVVGSVSGGGAGQYIIFEILTESGVAEASSNRCEDKLKDAASSYEARVTWRPCGVGRVAEETDQGTVVVHDVLESFLFERENSEAQGRSGVALYMMEEGGYECKWVIIFIDWWREIQVIEDVIHTEEEIRFKVKKIKVWDDCDLDDIVIPLIDCQDES